MARKRRSESRDDYKFMRIVDSMSAINQRVNLIGVVIPTSIPKRSRGTESIEELTRKRNMLLGINEKMMVRIRRGLGEMLPGFSVA